MTQPDNAGTTIDAEQSTQPVRLAVFDFDGTSIDGNSPVILVWYLAKKRMLRKRVLLRIAMWGIAYKLRLPQNESWVRSLVFTAFEHFPVDLVDSFLADFYDAEIAARFRPQADKAMRGHAERGEVVIVVSASFEPVILRAMEHHPFDHQISTRMYSCPDGKYTRMVEGTPVEGEEKLRAVQRFGDEHYGSGNWMLADAYGDHHSDRVILDAAEHAHAVCPDHTLRRTAREKGWEILEW